MKTHDHKIRAREVLKQHGYTPAATSRLIKRAEGGSVSAPAKLAKGGKAGGGAKGGGKAGHTHVNVIVAPQGGGGMGAPRPPMPIGPPSAGAAPPPRPPMAPGMGGGMPPGAMPPGAMPGGAPPGLGRPPGMPLKRGGKVKGRKRA